MKTRAWLFAFSASLVACAGGVRKPEAPVAAYHEKALGRPVERVSGTCVDVDPKDSDLHSLVTRANACVKAAAWNQVEAFGQAIATRVPSAPWGAYYLSLAASQRKDVARARWMIELAEKKAPNQALFHYELARILWDLGDEAGVIREMRLAAGAGAELAEAHAFVGELALLRADLEGAKSHLRQARPSAPQMPGALLALAQVEIRSNDFNAAEEVLAKAIRANPRHGEARLALARVQENNLRKFDDALRTLKELRQLSSEHKLDGELPTGLNERIEVLEKTVSQAKREEERSRMPSAERK